jgi:nucleoside-diphosphate-sugar epimerase
MSQLKKIIVTGGAGYVGAVLVPKLLSRGHQVKVIDLYIYGDEVLGSVKDNPRLTQIKGDIRDRSLLAREVQGQDTVIHLACISNDPSYELNPALSKSINYDAFVELVDISKRAGVRHFIYASSSSVYGIKDELEVTEDLPLTPLTDYSKYKVKCEEYLDGAATGDFLVTTIRPATVCGYSPRQRLDLTVNILTNHAVCRGKITVFGGEQKRPNLHIEDMTDLYLFLLDQPPEKIHRKIYNAGYQNYTVRELAEMVRDTLGGNIVIEITPTDDIRSYQVSSRKLQEELGFAAKHTIQDAVKDLKRAFTAGLLPDSLTDMRYYNIKTMLAINLQ